MKKVIVTAAFAAMLAPALSQAANTGPGCGVGTMIFEGQSGIFAHTLAATTNGSTLNQWFGITSGTLECDPTAVVSNEVQREIFVASNMDNITQEMAQGGGDHLASLADLIGIRAADRGDFYALTKSQLPSLMASSEQGAQQMLLTLNTAMQSDVNLAKYAQ